MRDWRQELAEVRGELRLQSPEDRAAMRREQAKVRRSLEKQERSRRSPRTREAGPVTDSGRGQGGK